jgi:hypothetical protein
MNTPNLSLRLPYFDFSCFFHNSYITTQTWDFIATLQILIKLMCKISKNIIFSKLLLRIYIKLNKKLLQQ